MATNTENLKLKKPAQEDFYNVDDFNENFQKLDDFAGRKDNPHGVTAEQIGAWKVSTSAMVTNITDLDNLIYSGFFRGTSDFTNTPVVATNGDVILVLPWDDNSVLQIFSSNYDFTLWYRKSYFGGKGVRLWKDWEQIFTTSGGTLTGGLKINNGYGSIGAIEQYASIAHIEELGTNNYRNLTITNQGEASDSVILHEVRDGVEVGTYKLYGEHNLSNFGNIITGSYVGTINGASESTGGSKTILYPSGKPKALVLNCYTGMNECAMAWFSGDVWMYGVKGACGSEKYGSKPCYLNWGESSVTITSSLLYSNPNVDGYTYNYMFIY